MEESSVSEDSRMEAEDSNEPSMEEEESSVAGESNTAAGGKRRLARSVDPYCVLRLRYRRLLAFLLKNDYWEAYDVINKRTRLILHMRKLVGLVKEGQWIEALNYVSGFAPAGESGLERTVEAKTLVGFLYRLNVLDRFVHGVHRASLPFAAIIDEDDDPSISRLYPCYFTFARHYVSDRRHDAMDMLDWQLVRSRAAKIAREMAYQAPEIRGTLHLPRGRAKASNIFPLLASSLPSPSEVTSHSGSSHVSTERLLAVLEEALQAGKRPGINQQHPTDGVDSVPVMQTMSTNSPCNHEDQQDENSPHEGVHSVPVMQTMSTNSPCNHEDQQDENSPH